MNILHPLPLCRAMYDFCTTCLYACTCIPEITMNDLRPIIFPCLFTTKIMWCLKLNWCCFSPCKSNLVIIHLSNLHLIDGLLNQCISIFSNNFFFGLNKFFLVMLYKYFHVYSHGNDLFQKK